ncbi:hypothetical protein F1C58_16685 (plasmid) [Glaciihabitans sp. INWT7]|uniref:hypothetical protein n=1 Tax=Glaciihabitans sp. INWT7 TaxID=2596912 RepID=UPI001627BE70|nr:hypothetical protein [Glaciihabitans sp. INWT7]QNE48694.1 hypothetical protein F1C58_16685 [Glaciihabitans sp. INWT7]
MTFNELLHPRLAGKFADKEQSAPIVELSFRPLSVDPGVMSTFTARQLSLPASSPVDQMRVGYAEGDSSVTAAAGVDVDLIASNPGRLPDDEWSDELIWKTGAVSSFFRDRFAAVFYDAGDWERSSVWFDLPDHDLTVDGLGLNTTAICETKISELVRLRDDATLGADLDKHLQAHIAVGFSDMLNGRDLTVDDVRSEVRARIGVRELDNRTALAGAKYLGETYPDAKTFGSFGLTGSLNVPALGNEIGTIYDQFTPADKDLASMIGTWALAKHRG